MADSLTFTNAPQAIDPAYPTHNVSIQKASNGFIVGIGCKVFVATTWAQVSEGLGLYFKDPAAAEKKYLTKKR